MVTGAGGLIGSWTAEYYKKRGDIVVGVDNFERSELLGHHASEHRIYYNAIRLKELGIPVEEFDISQPSTLERLAGRHGHFDFIFHLAAQCGVPPSIKRPRRDFEVNACGTLNVLEYARERGGECGVVYASTNKVYPIHAGWEREDGRWRWTDKKLHKFGWPVEGMNSDLCRGTRTPYGTSKYTGDLYCQEYAQLYNLRVGVFRMSCIVGEHQLSYQEQGWVTWFALANSQSREDVRVFGDGQQVRDVLHVSDVVSAYDAFVRSPHRHGVWNLGGGPNQATSVNECLLALQEAAGKKFKEVSYEDWRESDQRCYTSDIRPVMRDLKWRASVKLDEIYDRLVTWIDAKGHLLA